MPRLASVLVAMVLPVLAGWSSPEEARIELGRRLFYEADLSINGTMACATCHEQKRGFTDGNATHPGALDHPGRRNVPGLVNIGLLQNLTWANDRLTGLEEQAMAPLTGTDPIEMGMAGMEAEMARRLAANPCYTKLFAAAFPQDHGVISWKTVTSAIAAFERTFVSFDTDYDRAAAAGSPLAAEAEEGRALFLGRAGCATCHVPPLFTDDTFHRIEPAAAGAQDAGLAAVTGQPSDRGRFRTPTLRNVELTGAYWHDGSAPTLVEAIRRHGAEAGLSGSFDDTELARLIAFLGSLTDRSFVSDPRYRLPPATCPTGN